MKINEIIVVEGKDDTTRIKLAVSADTIETNGSAINKSVYDQIRLAKQKRGVIVFTDPDYPGERIRKLINEHVPGCKHAFLPKEKAIGKRGLGIEHASVEDIQEALSNVYTVAEDHESSQQDWKQLLLAYGLLGGPEAKSRRKRLGDQLQIGYANGKQLEKRLNMFQITQETFEKTMKQIIKEERSSE
ncbi:ribonuclease M5 [Halalkalibacillus sediminis]|uniref:Ribonuclease M5 n=1 Tax=Halalkalibacillus sediminis TaxID=2018042 RepID=A0A2I0QTS1_9BACI|nr:ribonuclease M5 [Halalkalibacillus sediminis]PKR77490.1 ribonuclease M5 [Halalkalibacillus sediminis]